MSLPASSPTVAEHVIALLVMWGAAAAIVAAGIVATLATIAAGRLRRAGELGRGRVERAGL